MASLKGVRRKTDFQDLLRRRRVIPVKVRGLARGTRSATSLERRDRAPKSSGYQRPPASAAGVGAPVNIRAAMAGDPSRSYRALVRRSTSPSGGTLLRLIREDAEASLCGIPRAQLSSAGGFDELVSPECIDWLQSAFISLRSIRRCTHPNRSTAPVSVRSGGRG